MSDSEYTLYKKATDLAGIFKFATACENLEAIDEAIEAFTRCTRFDSNHAEIYKSYYRLGILYNSKRYIHSARKAFLRAVESDPLRPEPLIELARICINKKEWLPAFLYLSYAMTLQEPDYIQYHLMGITAFYAGKKDEGKKACEQAILKSRTDEERSINQNNLNFYLQ